MKTISWGGFLIACLFTLLIGVATADDTRDAAVDQDMDRLKTAMTTKDYGTLIDMMYEPVVKLGGGRDAMLAQSSKMADIVTFTSFTTTKPYTYVTGNDNDYIIVPTHLLMTVNGHHFDSTSYEFGIKPHSGGKWEYLDGAGMKPQMSDRFFPDLPKDTVLPEVSRKQLD